MKLMNTDFASAPYYVLLDENRRLGAQIVPLHSGRKCSSIYGFANKDRYEAFRANCHLAVTPYPLVKGYLQTQESQAGDDLKLVIVDAAGPNTPHIQAATMEAVLEVQEKRATRIAVGFELVFDAAAKAYRVEEQDIQEVRGDV